MKSTDPSRPDQKSRVRTFSATDRDITMLEAIADYHGFSKSATIASLIRKEFWRVFPSGTELIKPNPGARIDGSSDRRGAQPEPDAEL